MRLRKRGKMREVQNVALLEQEDCNLLYDALKVYICHLDLIKATCRRPVVMDGEPIESKIARARNLRQMIWARHIDNGKRI